jgi:hypothetical protein
MLHFKELEHANGNLDHNQDDHDPFESAADGRAGE